MIVLSAISTMMKRVNVVDRRCGNCFFWGWCFDIGQDKRVCRINKRHALVDFDNDDYTMGEFPHTSAEHDCEYPDEWMERQ